MLRFPLLVASCLAAFTSALKIQKFDDNYDNLGQSIALGIPAITSVNGLTYQGWTLGTSNPVTGTNGGVIPHTQKNTAVAVTTLTPTGNPGVISVGKGVKCFDAKSFYFGCILNAAQGQVSAATGCGINVSGFTAYGKNMVGSVSFNYDPASPMRLADLSKNPNYKCLTNLTIAVLTPQALALLQIDDFVHTNNS
ncbi:hypothetical protein LTS18_009339 [Coniosporium uncinatum]|uniref:Uncharacterized protein n=1 Tax=Coniosporium uncinatum TaxID=93489 RepID=A0ACC3DA62_9PEZI|nr:hypothetical protein LTS18_009339 [Coniosporium uncinatum]